MKNIKEQFAQAEKYWDFERLYNNLAKARGGL
jgi:hypothetical protein